jgi:hypothetical protein
MAKKCAFVVTYTTEVARFSNRLDAMTFAQMAGNSEVRDVTGLIGQFDSGRPTAEFAPLSHLEPWKG